MNLRRRIAMAFIAAIAPLAGVWAAKVLVRPRPFWIHFYDPEGLHFYAGLHLLRGLVPENVDNPGTPLQLLSAAIAAFTGATPARYEAFLSVAHLVELLLAVGGAAIVFFGVLRGAPLLARVTAVWLFFCAPQAFERIDIWSPELLYLSAGAATIAILRRWADQPSPAAAAFAGLAVGLGTAAKFVFLPWIAALVITMILRRRVYDAAAAAAGSAVGFFLGTLPIAGHYGFVLHRLMYLSSAAHADQTWLSLLLTAKVWIFITAAIVVGAIVAVRREQPGLVIFCYTVIALAVVSSARNPSFRYLLPTAIAVVGLFAGIAAAPRFSRTWQTASLLIVALLMAKAMAHDLDTHRRRIAEGTKARKAIVAMLPRDAVVVYGWRAPIPSFALRVTTKDQRYLAEVEKLYPRDGHLNPATGTIQLPAGLEDWTHAVVTPTDAARLDSVEQIGRAGTFVVLRRRDGLVTLRP